MHWKLWKFHLLVVLASTTRTTRADEIDSNERQSRELPDLDDLRSHKMDDEVVFFVGKHGQENRLHLDELQGLALGHLVTQMIGGPSLMTSGTARLRGGRPGSPSDGKQTLRDDVSQTDNSYLPPRRRPPPPLQTKNSVSSLPSRGSMPTITHAPFYITSAVQLDRESARRGVLGATIASILSTIIGKSAKSTAQEILRMKNFADNEQVNQVRIFAVGDTRRQFQGGSGTPPQTETETKISVTNPPDHQGSPQPFIEQTNFPTNAGPPNIGASEVAIRVGMPVTIRQQDNALRVVLQFDPLQDPQQADKNTNSGVGPPAFGNNPGDQVPSAPESGVPQPGTNRFANPNVLEEIGGTPPNPGPQHPSTSTSEVPFPGIPLTNSDVSKQVEGSPPNIGSHPQPLLEFGVPLPLAIPGKPQAAKGTVPSSSPEARPTPAPEFGVPSFPNTPVNSGNSIDPGGDPGTQVPTTLGLGFPSPPVADNQFDVPLPHVADNQFGVPLPDVANNDFGDPLPPEVENQFGVPLPPVADNQFGVSVPPATENQFGVSLPLVADNQFGVPLPPVADNQFGVPLPSVADNQFGVSLPPVAGNQFGVPLPPVTDNQFGVPLPSVADNQFGVPLPSVAGNQFGVPLPPVADNQFGVPLPPVADNQFGVPLPSVAGNQFGVPLPPVADNQFGVPLPPVADNQFGVPLPPVADNQFGVPLPPVAGNQFGVPLSAVTNANSGTAQARPTNPIGGNLPTGVNSPLGNFFARLPPDFDFEFEDRESEDREFGDRDIDDITFRIRNTGNSQFGVPLV